MVPENIDSSNVVIDNANKKIVDQIMTNAHSKNPNNSINLILLFYKISSIILLNFNLISSSEL